LLQRTYALFPSIIKKLTGVYSAKVAFSQNTTTPPAAGQKELAVNINAQFDKIKNDIVANNETSISVTWTGGGQHIKARKYEAFLALFVS
jgi:hypothetical protein